MKNKTKTRKEKVYALSETKTEPSQPQSDDAVTVLHEIIHRGSANRRRVIPSFKAACEYLGITDFSTRIFNSNSRGELMHLWDYIEMAEQMEDSGVPYFRPMFLACVKFAEENWSRPESCFQHMPKLMNALIEVIKNEQPTKS